MADLGASLGHSAPRSRVTGRRGHGLPNNAAGLRACRESGPLARRSEATAHPSTGPGQSRRVPPQHPGEQADREKQWFAELSSYLRTNVPDPDERVANEVARQLRRFLTPSTPPDAHESNQRAEDS